MPSSADDSFVTMPDSEARGVYIDLALISPVLTLIEDNSSSRSTTLHDFFQVLSPFYLPHPNRVWMTEYTLVPLLIELKPPPTRHPKDILSFLKQCLMCSPKFALQNEVILIAVAGDWWMCRTFTRDEAADMGTYIPKDQRGSTLVGALLNADQHNQEFADEDEREDPFNIMVHPRATRAKRMDLEAQGKSREEAEKAENAARIARQNQERDKRAHKRAERLRDVDAAENLRLTAVYPYTDEGINEYWNLKAGADFMQLKTARLRLSAEWSLPLRLGTKASAAYPGIDRKEVGANGDTRT